MRSGNFFNASIFALAFVIGGAIAKPPNPATEPSVPAAEPSIPDYDDPRYWIKRCIIQLVDQEINEVEVERVGLIEVYDELSYEGYRLTFKLDYDCRIVPGSTSGIMPPDIEFRRLRIFYNIVTEKVLISSADGPY
ncbi:hypothetical protein PspLS_08799 [Pyricularia sp. CBS 133598]|nr:hypothetical protein PspLS_08799 [Pyricularia sp. CBS 133598]